MRLFFRPRKVRVHLRGEKPSIDGIWVGNDAGHYRIANAEQIESSERTVVLEGELWIPAANVLHMQVFPEAVL